MPEVGIVMTLSDRVSSALKTIAGNAKAFDKNIDELEAGLRGLTEAQEGLIARQTGLKKALEASAIKVADARKEYRKLKDETSKGALDGAIEEQSQLQKELKSTEAEIRLNNKAYDALGKSAIAAAKGIREAETRSKSAAQGMKEDVRLVSNSMSGALGMVSALKKSGLWDMGIDTAGQFATTLVSSDLGSDAGNLSSSVLSGAASGAALGTIIPGIGTAVGIAAGGALGAINGGISIYQARDDSFRSYVQENVEGQLEEMDSIRASGSATAGRREQDQIAFAQRFGSEEAAREYLDQVKAMAVNTNYSYDEITGYSKSLLNTYSAGEVFDVLQKLSDATAGLNLDSGGVSMFISGLSRMRTTDKATQEYLNYFSERGLDVYEALSRGTGADKSEIAGMVTKGDISGTDAAQAILDYIQEEFGGLSETLASTYDAMVDNMGDAQANLDAMMGEGYNEARKAGIEAQADWLESGELAEAYKAIGAWKAELENVKERYIREAVDVAMGGEEYQSAEAAGDAAEMGRIIMQAKIQGMGEYNANEGKDEALAQELALIEGVRNDAALNDSYWDAGYTLGQEFSKGRAAGLQLFGTGAFSPQEDLTGHGRALSTISSGSKPSSSISSGGKPSSLLSSTVSDFVGNSAGLLSRETSGHAYGLERVPYDGYPALLHEGERVLTARDAREQDRGGTAPNISITVSGNTFGAGMDETAVARALADQIELQLQAGGGR